MKYEEGVNNSQVAISSAASGQARQRVQTQEHKQVAVVTGLRGHTETILTQHPKLSPKHIP